MSLFSKLYRVDTAATTLSCTGLDGDRHGKYIIRFEFRFATPSTIDVILARPNADTSSLFGFTSADFAAPATKTTWEIGRQPHSAGTSDSYCVGRMELFACRTLDGNNSHINFTSNSGCFDAAGAGRAFRTATGIYTDRTANLTSIDFVSATENFGVGSWVLIKQEPADNALL